MNGKVRVKIVNTKVSVTHCFMENNEWKGLTKHTVLYNLPFQKSEIIMKFAA